MILFAGLFSFLTACSNDSDLEEMITYQDERIEELEQLLEDQAELISDQQDELEEQTQLISNQQSEIEVLMQEMEGNQYYQDLPESEWQRRQRLLAHHLMENIGHLTVEYLGGQVGIQSEDDILGFSGFSRFGFVTANVGSTAHVILSYQINDLENGDIDWEVVAYVIRGGLRLAEERTPRHLTDLEVVTIRMYEVDYAVTSEWSYHEEIIQGTQLWEEVLRLMPEIWDLWYEGSTLYVDLMPVHWIGRGGVYDSYRAQRLRRTFSSFPHVSEIRFSAGGVPGLPGMSLSGYWIDSGYLYHIFNAEEERFTHICELAFDDPWISEAEWRDECE